MIVYLYDYHRLFAEMLGEKLKLMKMADEIVVYGNVGELTDAMNRTPADLLIIDEQSIKSSEFNLIVYLKRNYKHTRLILVTRKSDFDFKQNQFSVDLQAVLNKSGSMDELEDCISSAMKNGYYSPEKISRQTTSPSNRRMNRAGTILSKREGQIVQLICEEHTMDEIAHKLFLSPKTVQNHRSSIMKKLKAKNTAGIVRRAIALGFCSIEKFY